MKRSFSTHYTVADVEVDAAVVDAAADAAAVACQLE